MHKFLKKNGFTPRTTITDKWQAYAADFRDLDPAARHHRGKRKNNRIESLHVRIRRHERTMQGFRSAGSTQRFLSIHAAIYNHFVARRHLISASEHRAGPNGAFAGWRDATHVIA